MLAQNVQWKVRRTLAASIHEIANILGEQMASEELVDIFNDFLNVTNVYYFFGIHFFVGPGRGTHWLVEKHCPVPVNGECRGAY